MLEKIPDSIDKRDGSITFYALAPAAVESAELRIIADYIYHQLDIENKVGEDLDRYIFERSPIKRRVAGHCIKLGRFTGPMANKLKLGERFTNETYFFKIVEAMGDGDYKLEAEMAGVEPNTAIGRLVPVENLQGLETANIVDTVLLGYEAESDESLRERYIEYKQKPPTSGNIYHYKLWAKEIVGVGEVEVNPCWQGKNTVQLIITDSNMETASEELLNKVLEYIDPGGTGEGRGQAPIGAQLTVTSAKPVDINIKASIIKEHGIELEDVVNNVKTSVKAYLKKIAFQDNYVSYSKLAAIITMTDGIRDIRDLSINDGQANIPLESEEIPILSEVVLNE